MRVFNSIPLGRTRSYCCYHQLCRTTKGGCTRTIISFSFRQSTVRVLTMDSAVLGLATWVASVIQVRGVFLNKPVAL
jgi:hypothetical protein